MAIIPLLSKVLEKVVLSQLSPFLEDKLHPSQFGFRLALNTFSAIATAHGEWAKASSMGLVTGVAAFDLTAAFDTVDHDLFCDKLSGLGVGDHGVRWFREYLGGKCQRVRYNGALSSPLQVKFGIPQGSLLGPLFFLALIHDLPQALNMDPFPPLSGGTVGYADDVVIWISGRTAEAV